MRGTGTISPLTTNGLDAAVLNVRRGAATGTTSQVLGTVPTSGELPTPAVVALPTTLDATLQDGYHEPVATKIHHHSRTKPVAVVGPSVYKAFTSTGETAEWIHSRVVAARIPRILVKNQTKVQTQEGAIALVKEHLPELIARYEQLQQTPNGRGGSVIDPKVISADECKRFFEPYEPAQRPDESNFEYRQRLRHARAQNSVLVNAAADAVEVALIVYKMQKLAAEGVSATILVTDGGPGAGKSYALDNIKNKEGAPDWMQSPDLILDLQGESGGTKLDWILEQAALYGHRVGVIHVESNPLDGYHNLQFGIIPRTVNVGRTASVSQVLLAYVSSAAHFLGFIKNSPRDEKLQGALLGWVAIQNGVHPRILEDDEVTQALETTRQLDVYTNATQIIAELGDTLPTMVFAQLKKEATEEARDKGLSGDELDLYVERHLSLYMGEYITVLMDTMMADVEQDDDTDEIPAV